MRVKAVVAFSFAALFTLQSLPSLAASNITLSSRNAKSQRSFGPASRVSVPDGAGGLYISWADIRDGSGDIYLTRVTNTGTVASGWPADGLPVCNAPGDQFEAKLLSDGSNGVLVLWLDYRNNWQTPDGYAQRVNSAGVPQWTANGVDVITGLVAIDASVAPDGTGGVLIAWSALGGVDQDIFATRIDGTGALASGWIAGNLVCGVTGDQSGAMVTDDGAGGAIITWEDPRAGGGQTNVYAQRLNASGQPQWTDDGIQVDASVAASAALICSDGGTGAIILWIDSESATVIMGQRLNSAGTPQWTAGGLTVGTSLIVNTLDACYSDGLGGAIVVWSEISATFIPGYGSQRINGSGAGQWGSSGVTIVSGSSNNAALGDVVPDGSGAAYFIWEDSRNGGTVINVSDIYAQRVTAAGALSWTANGLAVCTATGSQQQPTGAIDGSGGLLVAWQDQRNFDTDIFAQRFSSAGTPLLVANGVSVFADPGVQVGELVVQSNDGGAFVFYNEKRGSQWDIRARKLNSDGSPAAASVTICSSSGHQGLSAAVDDFNGGAIVAWMDRRGGTDDDIYAQRVDINCAPQWTANGVPICVAAGEQFATRMVPDFAGGAILSWQDMRTANTDIYAQRVNASGVVQWAANGIAVCADAGTQATPVIASDGGTGAIIAWTDLRNFLAPAVYAQRLNGSGVAQWAVDGVSIATFSGFTIVRASDAVQGAAAEAIVLISEPVIDFATGIITSILHAQKVDGSGAAQWGASGADVCDVSSLCSHEHIVSDGAGGAYVAWSDGRSGVHDIYMQRIDGTGATQWTANGNVICGAAGYQLLDGLMRDAAGDAYLTWEDERGGQPNIYAQRVDNTGTPQWTADGVLVCGATRGQFFSSIAPWKTASPGRVYIAWTDNRAGNARYVYLQRLDTAGAAQWTGDGVVGTTLAMVSASAQPDRVQLEWYASASVDATVYRHAGPEDWMRVGEAQSDGSGMIRFEDRDIAPGARYGYRLGYVSGSQESFAGEVWVDVPTSLQLALDGVRPNPAVRDLIVSFMLPSSAPARLELIDIAGRQVFARELSGFGAGRHSLSLTERVPASGVYFMRLSQNGRSVSARTAFLK